MNRIDKFEIIRAYTGFVFFTWWGIWSYSYGNIFSDLTGFIISLGGII